MRTAIRILGLTAAAMITAATANPAQAAEGRHKSFLLGMATAALAGTAGTYLYNQQNRTAGYGYGYGYGNGYAPSAYQPAYGSGYAPGYGGAGSMCTVSDGYETVRIPCSRLRATPGY